MTHDSSKHDKNLLTAYRLGLTGAAYTELPCSCPLCAKKYRMGCSDRLKELTDYPAAHEAETGQDG